MLAVKTVSLASPSETSTGEKRKRDGKIRSKVWDHFTKVENKPECVCNHCKRVLSCATNGGTTHLKRHIFWRRCKVYNEKNEDNSEKCLSDVNASLEQESEFIRKKFDQERSWRDLTELIIKWELPFSLVEDPTFQKYVRGICPKYKFLSWDATRNGCVKQYETEKKFIKDILGSSKPRVCLTTETWTSSKDLRYMGLRVHFIDNGWKLHTRIIKFAMVPVEESGENLADIISSCLLEWNIDKICTITLGNCITNDVLARCLVEHYSSRGSLLLQGRAIQVRCWGHVLNLIVQEGLDEIKDSICRVRNAVKYVKLSPRRKIDFLQYADQEGISRGKMLILDLSTQWDSTYKMLGSALHYQRAYDRMRSRDPHFKYPPTPEDWEKAKIIHRFLKTFSVVTKTLSGAKGCTANVFFYEVCKILTYLRDAATDLGSILGRLALNVLEKFERYWIEKEPNILLSIAVVLDPRFKLQYLRFCYNKIYDSSLVGDLMGRVEDEFRKLFDEYAAQYEASCKSSDECTSSFTRTSSFKNKTNFMEEFYDFSGEEDIFQGKAELDVYLEENLHRSKTPSDEEEFDILQWWKVNSSKFPVLSRMAHDILAIPVSSIPLKCGFSADGRVLNKFQSSLLPSTIEALVCTQDWIQGEPVRTEFEEEIDTHFAALNISQYMDSE